MDHEHSETKTNTVLVAVLIVMGLLVAGALVAVVLGGVAFFYVSRVDSDIKQVVVSVDEAMHPVPDAEPDLSPQAPPDDATPTDNELIDAAKREVAAKLPASAEMAWSVPAITKLEGGWYRIAGALTVEGKSLRWSCELLSQERGGARVWDQRQLAIEE